MAELPAPGQFFEPGAPPAPGQFFEPAPRNASAPPAPPAPPTAPPAPLPTVPMPQAPGDFFYGTQGHTPERGQAADNSASGLRVLPPGARLAIVTALAPGTTEVDIADFRQRVLACNPTKHFEIPSQITPKYVCPHCGNRDQERFREEAKGGDVVCLGKDDAVGCGMVVEEHKLFEGSAYRVFEGEDDKNHHGPAPNKLYSAAHNMRTSLCPTHHGGGARTARLRNAMDRVELNLSNLGTDERRTRTGYKDLMKKKAFDLIADASSNLDLHETVSRRAQELFANYRDDREFVQRFEVAVCACVVQAAEEAAEDERRKIVSGTGIHVPTVVAPPVKPSKRAMMLAQPLASEKTLGASALPAAEPKRKRKRLMAAALPQAEKVAAPVVRAGKAWAAALDDLDELGEESD